MSPTIELNFWLRLLGILALEISLVVALAFAAQALTQSAFWRRTIWQSCLVCLLFLVTSEITGVGRGVAVWFAGKPPVERKFSVRTVPVNEQFIATPVENEIPPLIIVSEKEVQMARAVWWPGILWLAGLGLIFARILFARILFLSLRWRKVKITDAILSNRVSELADRLGIRRKIHLLESPGFSSPMTFGITQSCIGLPKDFAQNFSSAEQNAMLTHELAHVAARDPFWYLLADLTSALLWWHPLVWLARRRLHSASELAADEAAAIMENGPGTLAECLVNLGQRMAQSRSFGWLGVDGNGFRSPLGQRVERLLKLKEPKKNQLRGCPLFFAKTAITIFFGGLIIFTSGWIQNGKDLRDKDFKSAVQKSWNGSFASTALAALAVKRNELMAKNETQARGESEKLPDYDEVTVETLIYNDFSPEELEEIGKILEPILANQREGVLSSNDLRRILFSLSKFKEQMIAPWDCGGFLAPFDMVGSKSSGMQFTYSGNPTNGGSDCTYFTTRKNNINVVTGAEMSYRTTNTWSFSLVPQNRGEAVEIYLIWKDNGKEIEKKWIMPNDGGAIMQRSFPEDSSRNQLVIFSASRLPRVEEEMEGKSTNGKSIDANIVAATLIQDGKVLFEIGKLDEAEAKLNEALKVDPENNAAFYYKSLIKEAKLAQPRPRTGLIRPTIPPTTINKTVVETQRVPPSNNSTRTNLIYTTKGRQTIKAKLDRIRIGEVQFENLPLTEVLKSLGAESKKRDTDGNGINFLINPHANAGAPNNPNVLASAPNLNFDEISINLSQKNVRLLDVLNAIVQVSDKPIQYKIEDYAVVFSPKASNAITLYTRIFKLDSKKFAEKLQSIPEVKNLDGSFWSDESTGKTPRELTLPLRDTLQSVSKTNFSAGTYLKVRSFLEATGVRFDTSGNTTGKAVFFKDRTGLLMVRATKEDLDIIQNAVAPFGVEPPQPQVVIETKFVEINEAASRAIDWNQLLSGTGAQMITNSNAGFKLLDGLTNWPKPFPTQSLSNSIARNFTTVLTEPQFRTLIKHLEGQAGSDILTLPKVTTLSSRQTQISVENKAEVRPTPNAPETTLTTGPVLDVVAHVSPDGFSIQMPITSTIKEVIQEKRGLLRRKVSVAKIRQMSATGNVYDGQTLVLGEVTQDKNPGNKRLTFVFVTATIIGPAGNRVHSEKELSFTTNSIPKQPEQK